MGKDGFIFIGFPNYSGRLYRGHLNAVWLASKTRAGPFQIDALSALCFSFNRLFADALNRRKDGITHFALMHDDIVPENWWLDKLYEEMKEHDADLIASVVALKDERGLSSTAIDENVSGYDSHWRPRRLTMTEVFNDFPPTFTHPKLLLNTGLMLLDITKPWADELHFEFHDRIIKNKEGMFQAEFAPEDWNFSRLVREKGGKIFATRAIKCNHHESSTRAYHNHFPWGTMTTDFMEPKV